MLVLTCRNNKEITINTIQGTATLRVLNCRKDYVKLGFSGPREIVILRSELTQNTAPPEFENVLEVPTKS